MTGKQPTDYTNEEDTELFKRVRDMFGAIFDSFSIEEAFDGVGELQRDLDLRIDGQTDREVR